MDIPAPPILADITVNGRTDQGARATDEAGLSVRAQSRDRRADLADRGASGAEGRHAARVVLADAAVPDQAAGVRRAGTDDRRSDRLHAGASRGSGETGVAIPARADLHAARGQPSGRSDRDVDDGRAGGGDELAGWLVRSGNAHGVRRIADRGRHAWPDAGSAGPLGPAVLSGHGPVGGATHRRGGFGRGVRPRAPSASEQQSARSHGSGTAADQAAV